MPVCLARGFFLSLGLAFHEMKRCRWLDGTRSLYHVRACVYVFAVSVIIHYTGRVFAMALRVHRIARYACYTLHTHTHKRHHTTAVRIGIVQRAEQMLSAYCFVMPKKTRKGDYFYGNCFYKLYMPQPRYDAPQTHASRFIELMLARMRNIFNNTNTHIQFFFISFVRSFSQLLHTAHMFHININND